MKTLHNPALWKDDPDCGHLVAHEHQTHYCTYIRVPKLLELQIPQGQQPGEMHAILSLQAIELWLRLANADLGSVIDDLQSDQPQTYQPIKNLKRLAKLMRLLDHHVDIAESLLIRDFGLHLPVANPEQPSAQLNQLKEHVVQLQPLIEESKRKDQSFATEAEEFISRFQRWSSRFQDLLGILLEPGGEDSPTYAAVLNLENLLQLQNGAKADWTADGEPPAGISKTLNLSNDELMFIIVHQVFELWFRAILLELDNLLDNLNTDQPDVGMAIHGLQRVVRIQRLLVEMIHVPASMLPMDFYQFRDQVKLIDGKPFKRGLSPASGTESFQFREIEILGGLKQSVSFEEFLNGNQNMHIRFLTPSQEKRLKQPSLPEAFRRLLQTRGVEDLKTIFRPANVQNPNADLAELADTLLEFDHFFQQWRMNHLTMVQSMIGRKSGTGFFGPEYLKETLGIGMQGEDDRLLRTPQIRPRFFEDLWEVRTNLQSGANP